MKPTLIDNRIVKDMRRDLANRTSLPKSFLEDWHEDLDSALVLLQTIKEPVRNMLTEASVLDGAHALVDRVRAHIANWQELEQQGLAGKWNAGRPRKQ
jgi:hypothetical protein